MTVISLSFSNSQSFGTKEKDLENALTAYKTFAEKDPYSPAPHLKLTQVYALMGEPEKALKEMKKAKIYNKYIDFLFLLESEKIEENANKKETPEVMSGGN